jgi:hypothetical protein
VLVERGDALAADKLTGDRIVLGGDKGGERLQVDLLIQVGEFVAEEVDDAVGADRVDAGEQDEGAIAVRTREPGQVADVGGLRLGKVRGRWVALAGAAILEQPAAVVVLVEAEGRIALEDLADDGGEAWPADHDEIVTVQVQLAAEGDVLGRGVQLQVAGQVGEEVEGGEVLQGDDGPSAGGLGLERDGDRRWRCATSM